MLDYSHSFRCRESARTVRSLMAAGLPLISAIELASEVYHLSLADVLTSWGAL